MRPANAVQQERMLRLFERHARSAIAAGLSRVRIEDENLHGAFITINGDRIANFGSCAYLGLNLDRRLVSAAGKAVERFGTVYSSSTAYTSVDLYTQLEERLEQIADASVVLPTTTTLGHLAALPVIVQAGAAVIVDAQAHASVHMACQTLQASGVPVYTVPHNDMAALDTMLDMTLAEHDQVWYLCDGVYSMFGDTAPIEELTLRLERHPTLHIYYDDAHGFGWEGLHGRGVVLDRARLSPRMVVAVSLAKSFGSGGAAIFFSDPRLADQVRLSGGTMTFSGPIHPAELGAAVASADIHLSDEHLGLQQAMHRQIQFVTDQIDSLHLPVPSRHRTPIWFVRIGSHDQALTVGRRMRDEGFYLNLASFPAVPLGASGLRFTHTLYHDEDLIGSMLETLAKQIQAVTRS